MLNLAGDCSRFVNRHFEIITKSSPHICHSRSALLPATRESIVRHLYESHAQPFVRVAHGCRRYEIQTSQPRHPPLESGLPYGRRAIGLLRLIRTTEILDSVTLQRPPSFKFSWQLAPRREQKESQCVILSPEVSYETSQNKAIDQDCKDHEFFCESSNPC